jgi:macrolide transport system ATP-binding/permease protein
MTVPIVELDGVSRVFDRGRVKALSNIDLAIQPGEFVAITGRSGSGKTTLLNILGLLDRPTSGTYRLRGRNAGDLTEPERSDLRAGLVGFVFQDSHLIAERTVLENVELGLQLGGFPRGAARTQRARKSLIEVGLDHRMEAKPPTLSVGERQRVALARALVTRPSLVLCDEPTGNLDLETGEQIMALIEAFPRRGSSLVLVTHEPDLALRADRIVRLRDGVRVDQTQATDRVSPPAPGPLARPETHAFSGLVDFLNDIGLSVSQTPIRNMLAGAGAFLAVAIFVFSVALTTTSAVEVASTFDRLAATSVEIVSGRPENYPIIGLQVDTERIESLPGAVAAGIQWGLAEAEVVPGDEAWITERRAVQAAAVDLGATEVFGFTTDGPGFTLADHALAQTVMLIGAGAVREFDNPIVPGMTILVDGVEFRVAGIITDAERGGNALVELLVPASTAVEVWPSRMASARVVIEVEVGAAETIAEEAPLVVDPNDPERLVALYDPEAIQLRENVTSQVDAVAVLVSVGLLLTGVLGIAGSMFAAVSERRHEIGIRRALGARRCRIAELVLGEAGLIGAVASLAGLVAGLAGFLAVSITQAWSPVLLAEVLIAAPIAGVAAGLIAGVVPALSASRVEPAEALRS